MITQTKLNQYITTNKNTKGVIKMETKKYDLTQSIIDGLTQKKDKDFDNFITLLSTKCLENILDDPEIDFLTPQKEIRINDCLQARYTNHYAHAPISELLIPKTKKDAIDYIKTFVACASFSYVTFDVPVEYAGAYIDTVNVTIKIGRDAKTGAPIKKTSALKTIIGNQEFKGMNAAKKALEAYEKATNIEWYELELYF